MAQPAHLFPSADWIDAFCVSLRTHPQAEDTARALSGVYRFVIEPAGSLAERHTYDVAIQPSGNGASVTRLATDEHPVRLTLTADYDRWRQLLEGRLDIKVAILLRRLRVSGDLASVTSKLDETRPLLEALSSVNTRWRD